MVNIALIVSSVLISTVVILFPSLGETFTELSGVYNFGLEGIMLISAASSFVAAIWSGSLFVGILVGMLSGCLIGLLQALFAVNFKADQIVFGIGLIILGEFLSSFIVVTLGKAGVFSVPTLPKLPTQGLVYPLNIILRQDALVYLSFVMVVVVWFVLFRTKFGLTLRATGENPYVAASAGINVQRMQYVASIVGCIIASLGGVFIILGIAGSWVDNITAGNGFIAVAMVRVGNFRPFQILLICLLYGIAEAVQLNLQILGTGIPHDFLQMIPYLLGIVALAVSGIYSRFGEPKSLGKPYIKESR